MFVCLLVNRVLLNTRLTINVGDVIISDDSHISHNVGRVAFEKLTDLDFKGETYYTIR